MPAPQALARKIHGDHTGGTSSVDVYAGASQVEVPTEPVRLNTWAGGGGHHLRRIVWVFGSHHNVVFRGRRSINRCIGSCCFLEGNTSYIA